MKALRAPTVSHSLINYSAKTICRRCATARDKYTTLYIYIRRVWHAFVVVGVCVLSAVAQLFLVARRHATHFARANECAHTHSLTHNQDIIYRRISQAKIYNSRILHTRRKGKKIWQTEIPAFLPNYYMRSAPRGTHTITTKHTQVQLRVCYILPYTPVPSHLALPRYSFYACFVRCIVFCLYFRRRNGPAGFAAYIVYEYMVVFVPLFREVISTQGAYNYVDRGLVTYFNCNSVCFC